MKKGDEGLALETSAFESLYGGHFTLSTQLIKPNYPVLRVVNWEKLSSIIMKSPCSPDRSRFAPLALGYTRLAGTKPNRETVRRLQMVLMAVCSLEYEQN